MRAVCPRCNATVEVIERQAWKLEEHKRESCITQYTVKKGHKTLSKIVVTCTGSGLPCVKTENGFKTT